jgi:hypothetical protein
MHNHWWQLHFKKSVQTGSSPREPCRKIFRQVLTKVDCKCYFNIAHALSKAIWLVEIVTLSVEAFQHIEKEATKRERIQALTNARMKYL